MNFSEFTGGESDHSIDNQSVRPAAKRARIAPWEKNMSNTLNKNDPLADFLRDVIGQSVPIPLLATHIDVVIRGGLATVTTERTFRNSEQRAIEAAMTFPLPVDATLCGLSARIGGQTLKATAKISKRAREIYENAISKGKAAVLHEEPIKGIHVLSVAHVAAGAQIVVRDTWTAPLSFVGTAPRLRIPTTVGEIYGYSPLPLADGLLTGAAPQGASIGIVCGSGTASLVGAGIWRQGRCSVTLDRPIDIVVDGWKEEVLEGRAADGRKVTLQITPMAGENSPLDVGVLFDHSGSMGESAGSDVDYTRTKFDVAKAALLEITGTKLAPTDRVQLWEFNNEVDYIGDANGAQAYTLVGRLRAPGGGTEIGRAFDAVVASEKIKNLIVVTDGKSWALDPQLVARSGIRVNAVLIGEDALEAQIAHLASMTGGHVCIAAGAEAGVAISAAFNAARLPHLPPAPIDDRPVRIETFRRGGRIIANWGAPTTGEVSDAARQVGATAAALAVPLLTEQAAAALAESENIVTHLTSLILVDETGERCAELPARRKMPLATARTTNAVPLTLGVHANYAPQSVSLCALCPPERTIAPSRPKASQSPVNGRANRVFGRWGSRHSAQLDYLAECIDWDADPEALRKGNLWQLPSIVQQEIRSAAEMSAVAECAAILGLDPVVFVIALLARVAERSNHSARRLAHAVLGTKSSARVTSAMRHLGL
jgi:hypothetical protein